MLLVLDTGNTNVTAGLFRGTEVVRTFRMATRRHYTADEYGVTLLRLVQQGQEAVAPDPSTPPDAEQDWNRLEGVAIASVVPPVTAVLAEACRRYLQTEPLVVGSHLRNLISLRYEDPRALGADRLANAVAAWALYAHRQPPPAEWPPLPGERPVVAVDFGTATKLEVVSAGGVYLGGAIAPGLGISTQALHRAAARLPRVGMTRPRRVLGRDNASALQSGFLYGFAGQVDGILDRVTKELGEEPVVVATGGLAQQVYSESRHIAHYDPHLTLAGVRLLWEWNQPQP